MGRVGSRRAVLVLIIVAILASLPVSVTAPGAPAADAGGGQGGWQVSAAPLDEPARSVSWLDS